MTTETNRPGAQPFAALENALEIVDSLREVVVGKDRLHFFRIAAGSAEETRVHLRVAVAWGWLDESDVETSMALVDRQLRLLWGLTR